MKTRILITITALFLFVSCTPNKTKEESTNLNAPNQVEPSTEKLHVYYFYGSHRCATCNAVETNLKQVMTDHFTENIKEGELLVSYVNWEDEANKKLVEKHQIYSSSLLLVKKNNGNEEVIDFTEYAFANARKQPEQFRKTLQDSIQNILN